MSTTAGSWFYGVTEPGRAATWNGPPGRGTEYDSRAAEGQLPVFSSSLCRTDAKAATPGGADGLRAGHVDQSQQSRLGWRARHVGDGKGSRHRDCRHGRLDKFSGAPLERRNDGKPGSLMGCGATPSWEENSGERTGALHAPQNQERDARLAFDQIGKAHSIVIDPHKHGLQPYGCGCVLFRDPRIGRLYKHDSPYTYFSSAELHLGEISLECSRPGAAAAALWATQRLLPLEKGGEFAGGLERGRKAALALFGKLREDVRFVTAFSPELDIVVFAPKATSVSGASVLSRKIFEAAARRDLHLAVAELPIRFWEENLGATKRDRETIACLRSVLIKPEHFDWVDRIWGLLSSSADEILSARN